jgi:hypothetical protein
MRVSGPPTVTSPNPPFRPFCDGCGSRFEEGQLRPLSKFCSYCGQPLSPWTVRQLAQAIKSTSNTPTLTANRPSLSPEDDEPVRPVGRMSGRRQGQRRLLSESSSDGEDDLPITPSASRAGREKRQVLSETPPGQDESPNRTKRPRGQINYSVNDYYQKMMRPSAKPRAEPSSKRVRTGPSTRSGVPRVHTILHTLNLTDKVKPPSNPPANDLSETTREEEASSQGASADHDESMDSDHDIPDDLQEELDQPIPSYRRVKAFGKRSKPFLHPPFVHSDRAASTVRPRPTSP